MSVSGTETDFAVVQTKLNRFVREIHDTLAKGFAEFLFISDK
jgi:hypothetical protein